MILVISILVGVCVALYFQLWELRNRMENMEKIIKSINDDLNMVSKTMDNMHKHEKTKELSKQILKG